MNAAPFQLIPAWARRSGRIGWLLGAGWGLANAIAWAAGPVTTAGLLQDMTDLSRMAEFPDPPFTCRQFSSYDRKSTDPAMATEANWFANGDFGQFLRVEETAGRKEHVMMDAAGPGAVVRIWSANPDGVLRVYLDGNPQPVIEAAMKDLLGGAFPGLPKPLAGERSRGWNLYFPIPYATRCKITCDKPGFYYHVNHRTYPAGTPVETFSAQSLAALQSPIAKVAAVLASADGPSLPDGRREEPFHIMLAPGQKEVLGIHEGAAIARVALRVSASDLDQALRGVLLKGAFDGNACIDAPLGDFFGSGPGINPLRTLPLRVAADGEMVSNWWMPFESRAEFELVNTTGQTVVLTGTTTLCAPQWTSKSMHFHAKWRSSPGVPTRPMIDWNYLTAKGVGVFAGASFTIDNPVKDWWGEGDEKIYVDGEKLPSTFGTGTEDYFGYAWCWPGLFTHAYHSQARCDGPGNYGRTSVNRFHLLDRIPFTRDFRFDMELWHWHANSKVNMAVTSYWYARPGATDSFTPVRAEDAVVHPMPAYVVPRVAGALEGETLRIVHVTGTVGPQDWDGTSGGRHLWWHAGIQPGATLAVGFPVAKAGTYRIMGRFLEARDYGIHRLAIDGRPAGDAIDFYAPTVRPGDERDLGVFVLSAGEHQLTVTAKGANDKADRAYLFGLDYLRLVEVE